MKVLHVLGGAEVGGTERQLLVVLRALAGSEASSAVLLIRDGPLRPEFEAVAPTRVVAKRGPVDVSFVRTLRREIRRAGPDIVHAWGDTATLWAPLVAVGLGAGLVVNHRNLGDRYTWARRLADRLAMRRADVLVGNSDAVAQAMVARGAPPERTTTVVNAVEGAPADPADDERDPGLLVVVGRLDRRKGQDIAIRALARLRDGGHDVRLVLAGPAASENERAFERELRELVETLGVSSDVAFVGRVDDPMALLRRAAVALAPSRTEGSPNAVIEAMLSGAPVVAARVGGIPELVGRDVYGTLVPPDDPAGLAGATAAVLADRAAATERASAATAMVLSCYSPESVRNQWIDVYRRAAGRAGVGTVGER